MGISNIQVGIFLLEIIMNEAELLKHTIDMYQSLFVVVLSGFFLVFSLFTMTIIILKNKADSFLMVPMTVMCIISLLIFSVSMGHYIEHSVIINSTKKQ